MDDSMQLFLTINVKMDLFWDDTQRWICFEGMVKKMHASYQEKMHSFCIGQRLRLFWPIKNFLSNTGEMLATEKGEFVFK